MIDWKSNGSSSREEPLSLVRSEIAEQPEVLERLLAEEGGAIAAAAREIARRRPRYAVIAARGSSDNAARYAQHLLGRLARMPVALATPSLHTLYHEPPRYTDALVLGISQSGESPDIVAVLEEARRQGCATLAITNDPGSPLALAAGHCSRCTPARSARSPRPRPTPPRSACSRRSSARSAGDRARRTELQAMPEAMARQLALAAEVDDLVAGRRRLGAPRRDRPRRRLRHRVRGGAQAQGAHAASPPSRLPGRLPARPDRDGRRTASRCSGSRRPARPRPACASCSTRCASAAARRR